MAKLNWEAANRRDSTPAPGPRAYGSGPRRPSGAQLRCLTALAHKLGEPVPAAPATRAAAHKLIGAMDARVRAAQA